MSLAVVTDSSRSPLAKSEPRTQERSDGVSGPFYTLALLLLLTLFPATLSAQNFSAEGLDQMDLERYKKVREVERYQLKIAEGYYLKKDWKVAAGEYEKFITLYESSEAAPHAQLRWSICQVNLKQLNTAVRDGFQSVVDYWPESPEAVAATFLMARTCKAMGETATARKHYKTVTGKYPKHEACVYALVDLAELAGVEEDKNAQVEIWRQLTFNAPRDNRQSVHHCQQASRLLAVHYFGEGSFPKAAEALETTYKDEPELIAQLSSLAVTPIRELVATAENKAKGEQLANQGVAYIKAKLPTDLTDETVKARAIQYWYRLIDLHAAAGHDDQVPAAYAQMEKQFGLTDDLLARLAEWYKSKNRYDEARQTYGRYMSKPNGLAAIAYSYRQQQNYDQAVVTYNQLIGIDPEQVIKWKEQLAYTYREARKPDEAIGVYQEMLKQDPMTASRWLWEIAQTHHGFGRHREAIAFYRQADNFPSNIQQMAACHRQLKEYKEARLLYGQIVGSAENLAPWALYQIAVTWEEEGNKNQAITAYQTVCKQFPKDGHASQAHAHLQNQYKITITLGGGTDD